MEGCVANDNDGGSYLSLVMHALQGKVAATSICAAISGTSDLSDSPAKSPELTSSSLMNGRQWLDFWTLHFLTLL